MLSWRLSLALASSGLAFRYSYPGQIRANEPCHRGSFLILQVEDDQQECVRLREATRHLYAQLKEMERKHQEERERLQVGRAHDITVCPPP